MATRSAVFCAIGALCVLCAVLSACEHEPRIVQVSLQASEALGCQPSLLTSLRVRPLGDFPTEVRPSVLLDPEGGAQTVDRFPPETELVAVEASGFVQLAPGGRVSWEGGALVRLDGADTLRVPLLRFGRACALGDPSARVPEGAVLLALPDGRALIAGGQDEQVLASVITVRPGDSLAEASVLRLFSPRTGASGTLVADDRVVIAGGAVAAVGPVLDTVELLRVREGAEARLEEGFLLRPRRDHASVARAGRVLLIGGRDDDGAIGDMEALSVDEGLVSESAGPAVARWGARALTLDAGTVLVVGGEHEGGAAREIERLEDTLEVVNEVSPRADAAWVALPGGRAARFGGRDEDGWTGELSVLLERGETWVDLGEPLEAIEAPVALGMPDGRVLIVGLAPITGEPIGRVVDPGGTREVEAFTPARAATALAQLADGTVVEGDAEVLSLLRLDVSSPFDDPQASLFPAQPDQRAQLSLEAASAFAVRGDLLVATRESARVDLPTARFRDVRVELELRGEDGSPGQGRVLLAADGAPPHAITVTPTQVELRSGCVAPRSTPIVLERVGGALTIGNVRCDLDEPDRVAIGLALAAGSGLLRISVTRLDPR